MKRYIKSSSASQKYVWTKKYGELSTITRKEYFSGKYKYVGTEFDEEKMKDIDIVRDEQDDEFYVVADGISGWDFGYLN